MKPNRQIPASGRARSNRGFALIVTLSLMILLTVVAVGLLTLSSISLRSSGQGSAMATARANARLALMLAIGDLQKNAGPDQRITARADVIDKNIANPRLTGVWKSWEIKATSPPAAAEYAKTARDSKFLGWLASSADGKTSSQIGFASTAVVPANSVTLWGKNSLGSTAPAADLVSATKVTTSPSRGAFAWAVMDEGVKARINTSYNKDAVSSSEKTLQLGSGIRPGAEFVTGLKALDRKFFEKSSTEFAMVGKGITRQNFALAGEQLAAGVRTALKPLAHDVTTDSASLFTDTAHGGLKQDFHLLTNSTVLPSDYANKGVYVSRLGLTSSAAPSDPSWNGLQQFARLYRDKVTNSAGVPLVKAQVPPGWLAATVAGTPAVTTVNRTPPTGLVLMPNIAKVQMLFSLTGRDLYNYPYPAGNTISIAAPIIHEPQGSWFRNTKYQYDLHLLYTPIVSLHNPYNVAIELNNVRLEFVNIPFAMQVFRNGLPQSNGLVPLETMYGDNTAGQVGKVFGMNLKTKVNGKPGATTFRLMPGEVKMFSAYIDPTRTYATDLKDRKFWDIYVATGITTNIEAMPGWGGDGIGFDCDQVLGSQPTSSLAVDGQWKSGMGLARDDKIHVLFAPLSIPLSKNKFVIKMSAVASGSSQTAVNAIEMDYESPTGLQDFIIGKNGTLRYPKSGTITGIDLVDHSTEQIKNLKHVKPFALLSCQAKTTSGGRDASNEDGRLATKPWCFAHANIGASSQKVVSEHSANFSHEIDLQLLEKGTSNLLSIDPQDRTVFITGHTGFNGAKFGGQYDIPLAPIQSLATLNGANPGGSSGYLPRFAQPIGNSWAHPLIQPNNLMETRAGGNYLDHSFLLNLALYDSCYFSGLADQLGTFGTGKTATTLATSFSTGTPLADSRMTLLPPDGKSASDFPAEVAKTTAYNSIAAWQMLQGGFNVNSTSVTAWKAMLASIHDAQALVNQLEKTTSTSKLTALTATPAGKARISRYRLPAAEAAASSADLKDSYWLGPRDYSDAELQTLAENIVNQVRLRGPFLSMADFVNRQLGSGDAAQRGALQQAIDDSNLNAALANTANAGFDIPVSSVADYKYANAAAGAGPSYQGAPGYLTQADILSVLGNAATPRSDTFTIRAYGEARDSANKVTASATCEAVIQRIPDYVDSADKAEIATVSLTSTVNKTFGRRFLVSAMRWLSPDEI